MKNEANEVQVRSVRFGGKFEGLVAKDGTLGFTDEQAAQNLGMSVRNFRRLAKKHGMAPSLPVAQFAVGDEK